MNVSFDGVEALCARYAYLSGGGCTAICGAQVASFTLGGERALEDAGSGDRYSPFGLLINYFERE